jgi:cellulose synthase (UDP-forming)
MNNSAAHSRASSFEAKTLVRQGTTCVALALTVIALRWFLEDGNGVSLFDCWQWLREWGSFQLRLVSTESSLLWILTPAMLMLAWAGIWLLLFDKPPNWLRVPVGAVFLFLQVAYLSFRLVATLSLDTLPNAICSLLFFLSEVFVHGRIALGNLSLLRLTDRRPQADESARVVRSGQYVPTVDVFLPTYSEPVEILRRSIIGCQAMDYPYKTIWLLDDQGRPAMRELARELGCCYVTRPDNAHAKAGNLNHALPLSEGELVVCFDADFIPTRDFLQRTVGFFRDPAVALVQTPQNFFNEDAVMRNFGLERVLEDEQKFFFRALQAGRDARNAIVCHGTCWVARRSALEDIGGIPTETITEDWATSIKLQAAGYKLLYLNEALSAGLSADTCGEFVQQRMRWAQGTLQALFASTNPVRVRGLSGWQRLLHLSGILYYLGSVSTLFVLLAPLFYLFFGVLILQTSIAEMLFFRLPLTLGYYMLFSWLTLRTRSAVWTEFYDAFLAPAMSLTVARSLWKPFGVGFRVTDKSVHQRRLAMNRKVALPFAVLIALHVAGVAFSLVLGRHIDQPETFGIVAYFTLGNLAMLWLCLLASIDVRRPRPYRRFEHRVPFELGWEDGVLRGETLFLSEADATIACRNPLPGVPQQARLNIPSFGLLDVPVRIQCDTNAQLSLAWLELSLPQRRALITHLYCRPGQWNSKPKNELRAIWEYARAGLRMYPLAESR